MNITLDTVMSALITVLTLLFALLPHEIAHGYTAYLMGDRTAKQMGRLSFNPFRHINTMNAGWILLGLFVGQLFDNPAMANLSRILMFVGFVMLLQPVPINPANFRDPKKGMAITALMGPVMNLVIAFLSLILCYLSAIGMRWGEMQGNETLSQILHYAVVFFRMLTHYSIALAVFNLIPIPPLDGSRVLFAFLPSRYYFKVMQYERYIMVIFLVLLYAGAFDLLLGTGEQNVFSVFDNLCHTIVDPLSKSVLGYRIIIQ
ncbi:MAG: site-2 protease family protein [Clostridia bacterium]|nr:site-2 protease family protein [Clostridia bacterium]